MHKLRQASALRGPVSRTLNQASYSFRPWAIVPEISTSTSDLLSRQSLLQFSTSIFFALYSLLFFELRLVRARSTAGGTANQHAMLASQLIIFISVHFGSSSMKLESPRENLEHELTSESDKHCDLLAPAQWYLA